MQAILAYQIRLFIGWSSAESQKNLESKLRKLVIRSPSFSFYFLSFAEPRLSSLRMNTLPGTFS